jgi:tetratricopeptide (TPR) repeat protein
MDFGRHLAAVRNDKGYTGRGVTWVSMRVAHAATLDGYCAVEAKDWANAVAMLERAVALVPAEPMPRLELALALASVKRHEEALAQADRGLGQSRDGCMAALAWRRRGYILMEIGALGPAKAAYEKSLTLEPGSQLARNALATIATLLKQQGNRKAGEQHRFDPPAGELVHTVCTEPAAPAK